MFKFLIIKNFRFFPEFLPLIKGTVSVIISDRSDRPREDSNARFTTISLKALSDQLIIRNFSTVDSLQKYLEHYYCRKTYMNYQN